MSVGTARGTAPGTSVAPTRAASTRARSRFGDAQTRRVASWSGALLIVTVASLVPVLWIVFLSLKTPASATDGAFIPHHWTLHNYRDIFNAGIFTQALRNSIGIALIATGLAVILACAAAYAIA